MKRKKSSGRNRTRTRKAVSADLRLYAWLRQHGLKVPTFRLTPKQEQLLKAEIQARWPYCQGNKEYLQLSRRKCESAEEYLNLITRVKSSRTSALEDAKLSGGLSGLEARMEMLDKQCGQKFGLTMIVPPSLTTQQVLVDGFWRAQFIHVDPPVWCDAEPEMLERWIRGEPPELSPADLWRSVEVPIRIRVHRSKSEILRAVGDVVVKWHKVYRGIYKALGASLPNRERLADCKLFPVYVKAVELSDSGRELKEIADVLWPNETAPDMDKLTTRAKLYVDNGRLLLSGNSHQIGQKRRRVNDSLTLKLDHSP
jgi:hypothetical protein